MLLKRYLTRLSLVLATSIALVGCAGMQDTVVVETQYVSRNIQVKERPKSVSLHDVKFYAVTSQNIDQFLQDFETSNGDVVFFAMSVPDYENMSLNVAELKRYIEQQKALIVYYETNVRMDNIDSTRSREVIQQGTIQKLKTAVGIE